MEKQRPYKVIVNDDTVVFVNGLRARNLLGFLWLWLNLFRIIKSVKKNGGCFESIPAIVSPVQILMVSYWKDQRALNAYVRSKSHQRLMSYFYTHPKDFSLFNETYTPDKSGLYHGTPMGLAKGLQIVHQHESVFQH